MNPGGLPRSAVPISLAVHTRLQYDCLVDPFRGVLKDAWRLYRAHALPLILVAAALFIPARGIDALIYGSGGFYGIAGGGWSDLVDLFAALLMLIVVAKMVTAREAGTGTSHLPGREGPSPLASWLRAAAVAAILAAVFSGAWSLRLLAGHFAALIGLPTLYLALMGLTAIPVAVIEQSGPLASWLRSWRLIRRHELSLLNTLAVLWLISLPVMLVPILIASYPGLPFPPRHIALWAVEDILIGPLVALAVVLIYYRLSAARHPAGPGEAISAQPADTA